MLVHSWFLGQAGWPAERSGAGRRGPGSGRRAEPQRLPVHRLLEGGGNALGSAPQGMVAGVGMSCGCPGPGMARDFRHHGQALAAHRRFRSEPVTQARRRGFWRSVGCGPSAAPTMRQGLPYTRPAVIAHVVMQHRLVVARQRRYLERGNAVAAPRACRWRARTPPKIAAVPASKWTCGSAGWKTSDPFMKTYKEL